MAELESDLRDYTVEAPIGAGRRPPRLSLALALVVIAALVAVGLALSAGSDDTVRTGTAADDTHVPVAQASEPLPAWVDLELVAGWQFLRSDGELLVVGTHPLGGRDLALAGLARDDAVFTDFPSEGVVLVAGGDRYTAKFTIDPTQVTRTTSVDFGVGGESIELGESPAGPDSALGPGPALALGPPTHLPGGITVRRGDVPRSSLTLAAYIGVGAPATVVQEAEAMAATVHLIAYEPGFIPPPPPPGSRPGFDNGGVDAPPGQLAPAVSVDAPGVTYTVRAATDCAVIVPDVSGQPMGGGCGPRPANAAPPDVVAVLSDSGPPPLPPPGESFAPGYVARWPRAMVVLARVGPDARQVNAVLVDGSTVEGTIGNDGWALVATDGRAFLLDVRDARGTLLARTEVG